MASLIPYTAGLHRLGPETFAYLQPYGSWGLSNCGLVAAHGHAVLVDTLFTLELTRQLLRAVDAQLPGVPITTVVNTHANGDHCWGNQLIPGASIIGSDAARHGMHHEIPPDAMAAMVKTTPEDSPLGSYMRRFFGSFDFGGITLTPPTVTFTGQTSLHLGGKVIELLEVGPAHTAGDVIVHVPDEGVVFAGDVLFIGDHPVMWDGSIEGWIRACDRILATGAQVIVPGHGPVTDPAGVAGFRDYLEFVGAYAQRQYARGVPYWYAAAGIDLDLTDFAQWGHPERLVITIGNIYQGMGEVEPGGRAAMIDHMVRLYQTQTSA